MTDINSMKFTGKEVEDAWDTKIVRDQFAAAALTGLLANGWVDSRACIRAYEIADAMLEARKEKK
jgi:hypothetical protein